MVSLIFRCKDTIFYVKWQIEKIHDGMGGNGNSGKIVKFFVKFFSWYLAQ